MEFLVQSDVYIRQKEATYLPMTEHVSTVDWTHVLSWISVILSLLTIAFAIARTVRSINTIYKQDGWFVFEKQGWRRKNVMSHHILWTIVCVIGVVYIVHLLRSGSLLLEQIQAGIYAIDDTCGLNSSEKSNYPIIINILTTFIALFLVFRTLRPRLLIYPEALFEWRKPEDKGVEKDKPYTHLQFQIWNKSLFAVNNIHAVLYACKRLKDTYHIQRREIPILNHDYASLDWCLAHPDDNKVLISTDKDKFDPDRGFDYLELHVTATHPISNVTKSFVRKFRHEHIHRGKFIRKHWWNMLSEICTFFPDGRTGERNIARSVKMTRANILLSMLEYIGASILMVFGLLSIFRIHKDPSLIANYSHCIEISLIIVLLLEIIRQVTFLPVSDKWQRSCQYSESKIQGSYAKNKGKKAK